MNGMWICDYVQNSNFKTASSRNYFNGCWNLLPAFVHNFALEILFPITQFITSNFPAYKKFVYHKFKGLYFGWWQIGLLLSLMLFLLKDILASSVSFKSVEKLLSLHHLDNLDTPQWPLIYASISPQLICTSKERFLRKINVSISSCLNFRSKNQENQH